MSISHHGALPMLAAHTGARSARNELFQELKPRCVELSQLALRDDGSTSSSKSLIESTNQLLNVLRQKCQRDDGIFDEKLADYVFFPLSQVLRGKKKYTDRLSELTIKCVRVLLEYGWRKAIALDLAKQLLLLLTFVAGGVPGQESTTPPEELVIEAYGSLAALFRDLGNTSGGPSSLVETSTVPTLGHCLTVILDGITGGPSAEVQFQALRALDSIWRCIKDLQALSSFLPGTISALTKFLTPDSANRRTRKAMVFALEVLELVLISILSDIHAQSFKDADKVSSAVSRGTSEQKTLTKSWLKATTAQIKLALSNVIRLRGHESPDVREALNRLCITILDECHNTLAESASMLVETSIILAGVDAEEAIDSRRTTLVDLATIHPDIGELIKVTVYNSVSSLPRVMQSNDETAKNAALAQLSRAHEMLVRLNLESSTLEDALAKSLRDSVTVMMESQTLSKTIEEAEFDLNSQAAMTLASENALSTEFRPILMSEESQKHTRRQLQTLLNTLVTRTSHIKMASEMLDYVRGASGRGLLSAYWLSSQLLRSVSSSQGDLDEFFDNSLTLSDDQEAVNQELFSYSLSILSRTEESNSDWRLQAIALEVMADAAKRHQEAFRTELIDALYPMAQLLGSSNPRLREHTITCLNIVSQACGYSTVSDLIVGNVDYMVNAISLRLNTFDISPQAPQVLVMMIRLTGPSLLVYLDDVVESIFVALDNFHGYQKLVDILFTVLGEVVEVGSKSGQLQLTAGSVIQHRKKDPSPLTITDIIATIEKQLKRRREEENILPHKDFPRKPWTDAKTLLDRANPSADDEEIVQDKAEAVEIQKPPPTKLYSMIQSIARLGQHYLTNQSPHLRTKLLYLIRTACTALHGNEDEFLPLVNDIWPVIIKRLYDEEVFVQIAAADTVAEICRCAGDFLSTRIQVEWPDLIKLARRVRVKVLAERKGSGGRGIYSQARQLWESIVRLLISILQHVRIDDESFDDVLELLADLLNSRGDIREALSLVNPDAVWLALQVAGRNRRLVTPVLAGSQFAALEPLVSI